MTLLYPLQGLAAYPPWLSPAYKSTVRRSPTRPLIPIPHTLSELTAAPPFRRRDRRDMTELRAWHFTKSDLERKTVRMNETLTINTTPAVLAATLAGAGLAVLPDFLAMEDISAGRLTHILPAWTLPAGGIHAVYPAARFRPPKVTAFVAMLMEEHKRMSPTRVKRP